MTESLATPERPLLTIDEAAKALSVTGRTIYTLLKRGDLRSLKVAGARRIAQADIDDYLNRQDYR